MAFLEYLIIAVFSVLLSLMRWLPHPLAYGVARSCIYLLQIAMPRSRGVCLRNLELVFPEKSESERRALYRECFRTLAHNLVSFARLADFEPDEVASKEECARVERALSALAETHPQVGILFATAHMGQFELAVQTCVRLFRPVSILARGFGLPRVDAWWNRHRTHYGCDIFGRRGGFKETLERLRAGRDVVMLVDQNVKKNHAVFVEFFGIKAATTKTVGLAAIRTGAPVFFLTSYTDNDGKLRFFMRSIPPPDEFGTELEQQVYGVTRAVHEALEEVIRLAPGQWFWLHRRFKTRPTDEPETLYAGY